MFKNALKNKEIFKLAFRSYVSKCNLNSLKKALYNGIYLMVLLFVIYPFIFLNPNKASISTTIRYFVYAVPLVFSMILFSMHYNRLPKQMYLCPITQEERRQYILCHYAINIAIPFMVLAVTQFTALYIDIICLEQFVASILLDLLFCFSMSFHLREFVENSSWTTNPTPIDKLKTAEGFAQSISLFGYILLPLFFFEEKNSATIIYIAVLFTIQLLFIWRLLKNFNMMLEYNMDYENTVIVKKINKPTHWLWD